MNPEELSLISQQAKKFGAEFVGFAQASDWKENSVITPVLFPRAIWPPCQTVVVLAISVINHDSDIEEQILNIMSYRLATWLNEIDWPSVYIPNNESKGIRPLVFSHSLAGLLAGLGQIDDNGELYRLEKMGLCQLKAVTVLVGKQQL